MSTQKKVSEKASANKSLTVVKATEEVKKPAISNKAKQPIKKGEKDQVQEVAKKTAEMIHSFAPPSADERIKNAENFKILTNKFGHLKTKSDELKRFKISSDGTKEKIYLENAEGFKFEVSNSKIIDETLNLLETTLNKILSDTEKQVQEFVI